MGLISFAITAMKRLYRKVYRHSTLNPKRKRKSERKNGRSRNSRKGMRTDGSWSAMGAVVAMKRKKRSESAR